MLSSLSGRKLSITKWICPGGTDARFIREVSLLFLCVRKQSAFEF